MLNSRLYIASVSLHIILLCLVETAQLKTCGTEILKVTQDKPFSITLQCYDSNGEPTDLGELTMRGDVTCQPNLGLSCVER